MRALALVALLAAAACGKTIDVDLDLDDAESPCTVAEVLPIKAVRIYAYGESRGTPCLLASECVALGSTSSSIEDLESALRGLEQPLVTVDAEVSEVGAVGHADTLCEGMARLCGFADIAAGTVRVPVSCQRFLGRCNAPSVPICP